MEEVNQNPTKEKRVNAVDSLKEKFYSLIEKERLSKKSLSVKLAEIDRQKLKDLATEKGITSEECAAYIIRTFLELI